MKAVGGRDGKDAEQDAHSEAGQAHVVSGNVFLERLHECWCNKRDDTGGDDGCCGDIRQI